MKLLGLVIVTDRAWSARYEQGVELGRIVGRLEAREDQPLAAAAGEPAPRPRRPHPHLRRVK